jgi:hypothetical protein
MKINSYYIHTNKIALACDLMINKKVTTLMLHF